MTAIPSYQPAGASADSTTGSAGASSAGTSGAAAAGAAREAPAGAADASSAGEAVTLSSSAATTTQLLDSARSADGVNPAAVQRLRGAIQSGTYQVAPADLAKSISGALRESAT